MMKALLVASTMAGATVPQTQPTLLNDNAVAYDGQSVAVSGFLVFEPNGHVLYEDESFYKMYDGPATEAQAARAIRACLTVYAPKALLATLRSYSLKRVRIDGIFKAITRGENDVDMGACPEKSAVFVRRIGLASG